MTPERVVMLPKPVTSPGNSVAGIKITNQPKEDNEMKKNELQAMVRYNHPVKVRI